MQARAPEKRSTRARGSLFCTALTLYATWPSAYAQSGPPRWLHLTPELSTSPDLPHHRGEALLLKVSLELSDPEDLPQHTFEPLRLELAIAIGSMTELAKIDPAPAFTIGSEPVPVFYAVRVNGEEVGVARLLRLADGRWLARREDLEEWRLRPPPGVPMLFNGEAHYPLDAFEGMTFRVDEPLQAVEIEMAPKYFSATIVEGMPVRAAKPTSSGPGGFLNYDLFLSAASDTRRLGGLFETGVFNRYGVGLSSFVMPDAAEGRRLVRLDTFWRRDSPEDTRSLILGDAIGSSGVWGRPVRFGGVRYGTNFGTNPGFVTFPLPGLRGEAALPTTTSLYVDGTLRQSSSVPPGPFRLNNVPVVTGQGEVRLVVRDLLGREQVISLPYYASSQLLREGLRDDSYEIGFVRNNFGIRSDDYGRFVSAMQMRKGFSDSVTGEARAELLRDQQTLGAGGSIAAPSIGIFTAATAGSHSERGNGALLFTGFERQVRRGVSFGVRSQWTTERFTQLGLQPEQLAPVRLMSANVGFAPGKLGSIGVAYAREDNRDRPKVEIVSASYSISIAKSAALILFAFKPIAGEGHATVGATLSMGLGERTSASTNFTYQPHASQGVVQLQQNLPAGSGTGYRLLAGYGPNRDREEAGFSWQTNTGTYVAEAGRADGHSAMRASASGGIGVLDGRAFLARNLTDSFAIAQVPGFADVGISVNNQVITRTDAQGYAIVPRLLAYQRNPVRVEIADLPIDAAIDASELEAVPYYRSGLVLRFPVRRANGALIALVLDNGAAMPVGAEVSLPGSAERFPVAERGEVYVTGLSDRNRLRASWRGQSCEFSVDVTAQQGPLPRLGPITCSGVKP